jgi:glycosyltransferase involved in cell wall biosynthesis
VGKPASVDIYLNDAIERAIARDLPIRWTRGATDAEVMQIIQESNIFLSYGTEGYGIPVLESIRMGTPVVFDGIQPAAELMQGCGGLRLDLSQAFTTTEALGPLPLEPSRVPQWREFVQQVADATR